jgi:CDP-diglyceride synthetase
MDNKPLQYVVMGAGCLVVYALLEYFFSNGVIDWKTGIILAILVVIFNVAGDAFSARHKK